LDGMETSVLVTGGLGFVGTAIVAALHAQHPEWKLSVVDLQQPTEPESHILYRTCDITDRAAVEELVANVRPTAIIHTAGIVPELKERYSQDARRRVFEVNVHGTHNIVVAARNNAVKALVWTGSSTAVTDDFSKHYPNVDESCPTSSHSLIYGESKASPPGPNRPYPMLTWQKGCRRGPRPRCIGTDGNLRSSTFCSIRSR
ncbi:MAG: hypothetical protein Q9224_007193, partial [Gallowayella concinna]